MQYMDGRFNPGPPAILPVKYGNYMAQLLAFKRSQNPFWRDEKLRDRERGRK
jgi:hypothetical protein